MSSKERKVIPILFLALLLSVTFVPTADAVDYVQPSDISVSASMSELTMSNGDTASVYLDVHNKSSKEIAVYFYYDNSKDISVQFPDGHRVELEAGGFASCRTLISVNAYAASGTRDLKFKISISDPDRSGAIIADSSDLVRVRINSEFARESSQGMIMGLFDNNLPGWMGSPAATAVVSGAAWILIAFLISFYIIPAVKEIIRRKTGKNIAPRYASIEKLFFVFILMYGALQCFHIYGLNGHAIAIVSVVLRIYMIIVIAIAARMLYGFALVRALAWFDDEIEDGTKSDIYPLLLTIGMILIVVLSVLFILMTLNVESVIATVFAAVAGLAVSFGASSSVSQFFGGVSLLVSRPFKANDVIELNGDGRKLIVEKVGMMASYFRDWDCHNVCKIPNNTINSATIINYTARCDYYRIPLYMEFAYSSPFDDIKACILSALNKCDHIALDDPILGPTVEIFSFDTNFVKIRVIINIDDYHNHPAITSDVRKHLIDELNSHGIEMFHNFGVDLYTMVHTSGA